MNIPITSPGLGERFWCKVSPSPKGCWLWTAAKDQKGYGSCNHRYGSARAHRAAWISLRGEVPPGAQLDHLCHIRNCINPQHIRLATPAQNSENRAGTRSKSGRRGVYWYPRYGKWVVKVGHAGKVMTIGYFESLDDADLAAQAARAKYHSPVPAVPLS